MNQTGILRFNCGLANYKGTRPVFDAVSPAIHQILAIQEPGFNYHSRTTYCPKGYTLAFEGGDTTKVCFMISKAIPLQHWEYRAHSIHVAEMRVLLANE